MKSIWMATYEGNEIKVENTWFNGERLFVNGKLQDEKMSFFTADLSGHIARPDGQRVPIKVNIGGFVRVECRLFVNDEKIEITQSR